MASGCQSTNPEEVDPDPSAAVQTSRAGYRLALANGGYEATVPWTYVNRGLRPVYHARCAARLEKRSAGAWLVALRVICPQSGQPIDTIPPGVAFSGAFSIHSCLIGNCAPQLADPIPGVYRVVAGLYLSTEVIAQITFPRDSLPAEDRRSNAFRIDLPE